MAIDSQHTSTTDRDAAIEAHKDARARAYLIIGAASLAVALIIAAVVHFTNAKTPAAPIATRPSEASVEAQDKAAALKVVQQFNTASDRAARTGNVDSLNEFADDNLVKAAAKNIKTLKDAGYTYAGTTVLTPGSATWDRSSPFVRLVTLKVCADNSGVVIRDSQGRTAQQVTRKRIPVTYYVEAAKISGSQSAYKVKSTVPDPNLKATC